MGDGSRSTAGLSNKNWSYSSDSDDNDSPTYRRRSDGSLAKRARREMYDSVDGDIFKNVTSLPSSTPNQPLPAISTPSSGLGCIRSPTTNKCDRSHGGFCTAVTMRDRKNLGQDNNPVTLKSIDGRELSSSKSDESIRRLKSLVDGAVVSSSDDEELPRAVDRARISTALRPKSKWEFRSRMANAILDLDDSGNEGHDGGRTGGRPDGEGSPDLEGRPGDVRGPYNESSSDCIIEGSAETGTFYSARTVLDPVGSKIDGKAIHEQTTIVQRDIVDCETDPPSSDAEEPDDPSPKNNEELTPHELGPVKSEFPGDKSEADGQKVDEVLNLVDSCSIVDLCDSSVEVVGSEQLVEPLPRLVPPKPPKIATVNPSKKRLMDVVLAGCKTIAPLPLTMDPLDSFHNQYFSLDPEAKDVFDQLLIPSFDNDFRWLRCYDGAIADQLVANALFMFLDDQDDFFSRLIILLNSHELAVLFSKLNPHPRFNAEAMRAHLLQDLHNCPLTKCANGFAQRAATELFAKRFLKMRPKASFAAKMALDLFALPLNLHEKAFKHGDIARYVENLQAEVDSGRTRLLSLATGNVSSLFPSKTEFQKFADSFALKINIIFAKHQRPQLKGMQTLPELCAELAIVVFGSSFQVNENPIFAFQVVNLVRALDEKIVLLHTDDDEVLKAKFLCLGVLLQQEVTQFAMKGVWARKKMTYFGKILGIRCDPQQLEDVLTQNVSPLEQHVRTNFVAQVLSSKRKGLTGADKRNIKALLTEPSFSKSVLKIKWPTGDRKVNLKVISPYEEYYRKKYPFHVLNPGPLLMNAIFLAFWPNIYHPMDDVFFSDFQTAPVDWGGEKFYERREGFIAARAAGFAEKGIDSLIDTVEEQIDRFSEHHCLVDWPLVGERIRDIRSLLTVLGLDKFLVLSKYILGKAAERELAFPELAMWDHGMKVQFVGLKNPTDPLYPHQFVWLEKLTELGIPAHECQVTWMR